MGSSLHGTQYKENTACERAPEFILDEGLLLFCSCQDYYTVQSESWVFWRIWLLKGILSLSLWRWEVLRHTAGILQELSSLMWSCVPASVFASTSNSLYALLFLLRDGPERLKLFFLWKSRVLFLRKLKSGRDCQEEILFALACTRFFSLVLDRSNKLKHKFILVHWNPLLYL